MRIRISVNQLARELGVPYYLIYKALRQGQVPCPRWHRRYYADEQVLAQLRQYFRDHPFLEQPPVLPGDRSTNSG